MNRLQLRAVWVLGSALGVATLLRRAAASIEAFVIRHAPDEVRELTFGLLPDDPDPTDRHELRPP